SITDPKLNVQQTYTLTRYKYKKGKAVSSTVLGRGIPVAPNNVGPKTIPNYAAVANQAIRSIKGGGKVFAGQRDDPFFVDLGGYGVHAVVLQVPKSDVTVDGKAVSGPSASNAVVGVWSSTDRPKLEVQGVSATAAKTKRHKKHA